MGDIIGKLIVKYSPIEITDVYLWKFKLPIICLLIVYNI